MLDKTNSVLFQSVLKIIRPLIRIMLRNGISNGSFEELARKAYVDEAFSLSEKQYGKTTVSSVSAHTGLSRKEVKRLSNLEEMHHTENEQRYNRAVKVISGWVNDDQFTDSNNQSKILPVEGDVSFTSLVKQFSGDVPMKAMLNLLLAADCIVLNHSSEHKNKQRTVELIKHAYVPSKDSTEIIRILGTDTNELINTIDYNLSSTEEDKRYQRKVSTVLLDKNAVEEFKAISNKHSQALLEELDAWISEHEVEPDHKDARYVSLGIYYYDESQ
jgi:hypothetical protein